MWSARLQGARVQGAGHKSCLLPLRLCCRHLPPSPLPDTHPETGVRKTGPELHTLPPNKIQGTWSHSGDSGRGTLPGFLGLGESVRMSIWLEKARDDPVRLMRHVTTSKSHSHPFLFGDTVLFTQERSLLDTCSSGAGARKQPTLWHLSALK